VSRDEFRRFVKHDSEIREVLVGFEIAREEDLGINLGDDDEPDYDSDLDAELNPSGLDRDEGDQNLRYGLEDQEDDSLFAVEDVGEGDQAMATKPWKGVIDNSQPDDYEPNRMDKEIPDASLELEYVYGYRCHDARNNLRYINGDQFVWHTAALGIVMDPRRNKQKFHNVHQDDVLSIAVHPTEPIVATGEIGPHPTISIWSSETME